MNCSKSHLSTANQEARPPDGRRAEKSTPAGHCRAHAFLGPLSESDLAA